MVVLRKSQGGIMNRIKIWPHLAGIALVFAAVGGVIAALWVKHSQNVEAATLPNVARVERVDGQVGLNRSLDYGGATTDWIEVTPNTPISVGDRIFTRENSRAALAFNGRNFARIEPLTSVDVLSLSDQRTQVALRDGQGLFDIGSLAPGELFEVATPYGAVDLLEPGLYEVGINDNGSAFISVLSGLAQVVGLAGSGQISKGEMLTLVGQTAARVVLSRIDPGYAGSLVNDYYGYRYPRLYDGRYASYDAYLTDPYYYDPNRHYVSYQYVTDRIPGAYDLDYYGDWRYLNDYGYCWHPNVDSGWAPYQSGYWTMDYPYGLTWVSNEPWGFTPYHYGRWALVENQWFWVPQTDGSRQVYAPALVAFVPVADTSSIGWIPLAPGDPYVPRYYGDNWQPHYLTRTEVVQQHVRYQDVPNAITVVPLSEFDRIIDRRNIKKVEPQSFARLRPVLDPLAVDSLRPVALKAHGRFRRVEPPAALVERLNTTAVVASATPAPARLRKDITRALRIQAVPEKAKKAKLKFKDERQAIASPEAGQSAQRQRRGVPSVEASRVSGLEHARAEQVPPQVPQRRQMDAVRAQQERERRRQQAAKEVMRRQNVPRPNQVKQQPAIQRTRQEDRPRVEFKGPPVRQTNQRQMVQPERQQIRRQEVRQPAIKEAPRQQAPPKHVQREQRAKPEPQQMQMRRSENQAVRKESKQNSGGKKQKP